MDKQRFEEIVEEYCHRRIPNSKRQWCDLTENERMEATPRVSLKQPLLPCEDCGELVSGRRIYIYNNQITGRQGKRSRETHWVKHCSGCERRCDYTGSFREIAK